MSRDSRKPRKVSVAIPSWNGRQHLEICLDALEAQRHPGLPWEVLVLDNASRDGTAEWLAARFPKVRLLSSPENIGFARAVNRLVEAAEGDLVALLNNDTRPEPGWLAAAADALASAPADVAAVSGRIVDWEGERLDFAEGVMTFDGHAFQNGYRRPLEEVQTPAAGSELLFPCGANAMVRRDVFQRLGGFDGDYFAYFEDVDLGWRLWAAGWRVLYAPEASVHHRSMATSELLGRYRRGMLFERNAFLTTYKNYEAELFSQLMPAILWTLMCRAQTLLADHNPGGAHLRLDPFPPHGPPPPGAEAPGVPSRRPAPRAALQDLRGRWRRYGAGLFLRRGLAKLCSSLVAGGGPVLTDERTVAHLRAVSFLLGHLDRAAEKRRRIQAQRRRGDAEIFRRFPLYLVPTYPGDEALFASPGFRAWLPEGLPLRRCRLEDLMEM